MTVHLLAFGANLGCVIGANARKLAAAAHALGVTRMSRLYRTSAWPPGSGPDFVNAVGVLHASAPPEAILARLHGVEARLGRVRGRRWGARSIDIDLLASGALVRPDPTDQARWRHLDADGQATTAPGDLILPHPRLQDRAFVLVPLCDVAPDWRHPLTGRTARAMRDALPSRLRAQIRPIGGLSSRPPARKWSFP